MCIRDSLGSTRDDAAGECFDKAARVLGMPYPGGKPMDELAQQSAGGVYDLPRASIEGHPLDMSFSGLKTAVVNLAHNAEQKGEPLDRARRSRGTLPARCPMSWCRAPCWPRACADAKRWSPPAAWPRTPSSAPT